MTTAHGSTHAAPQQFLPACGVTAVLFRVSVSPRPCVRYMCGCGVDITWGQILFHPAQAIVQTLFKGGYYSTCGGYYSRKYVICIQYMWAVSIPCITHKHQPLAQHCFYNTDAVLFLCAEFFYMQAPSLGPFLDPQQQLYVCLVSISVFVSTKWLKCSTPWQHCAISTQIQSRKPTVSTAWTQFLCLMYTM